jgi:hypothetical protein
LCLPEVENMHAIGVRNVIGVAIKVYSQGFWSETG